MKTNILLLCLALLHFLPGSAQQKYEHIDFVKPITFTTPNPGYEEVRNCL